MVENRIRQLFHKKEVLLEKKKKQKIEFLFLKEKTQRYKETKATIDDITWADLNMDDVFVNINYTLTTPGEETLYGWLRNPLDDEADYHLRKEEIDALGVEQDKLSRFQQLLARIGYTKYDYKLVMENDFCVNYWMLASFILIGLVNIALIILSFVFQTLSFLPFLLIIFGINMFIHYRFNVKYGSQVQALAYTFKLIGFCKKSRTLLRETDITMSQHIYRLIKQLSKISRKEAIILRVDGLDVFADYFNIIFLIKEINFLLIAREVKKYQQEIVKVYDFVGKIDAMISILKYRDSLEYYSEPDFDKIDALILEAMYHPILEEPVSNSISIHKGIAITGSNMSGKSTFLRTVGINTIFAQSLCISLSKKYQGHFQKVVSSISLSDDILEGKSYFLMEAEAIKRIVDIQDSDYPSIVLIDELFKGTNPLERLAASMEILNDLVKGNVMVLLATHDLQILPELEGYDNYYFTENVTKDSLSFDYKIRSGITQTRNAIKLMELVRYPKYLTDKIHKRIDEMEHKSKS